MTENIKVLKKLLNKNEFFHNFIDILNENDDNISINKKYYTNYNIYRERERIDILVEDKTSKHAIIIENKINNAVDQSIPKKIHKIINCIYSFNKHFNF